jgi:hypothetical protein
MTTERVGGESYWLDRNIIALPWWRILVPLR